MKKWNVCVLFGGMSPEHEVSLRSAESVLNNMDSEKYNILPVGITRDGDWILYGGSDYSLLPDGSWKDHPDNRRAAISPVRGQGLLTFEGDCVVRQQVDVVFPVLHGENGEDGAMQGLLRMAGIPYVGPHVSASAVAMDKTLTKLVVDNAGTDGTKEYIALSYKDGDMLYVPAECMDVLSKYVGDSNPPISKIGGADFERVKARVKAAVAGRDAAEAEA